jgi:hypothetical protein
LTRVSSGTPWLTGDLPRTPVPRTYTRKLRRPGFLISSDVENIIELLGPRQVIGQALALLMASYDVNRDAAFEMLVEGSSDSHLSVREFAATIVQPRAGE